MRRLLENLETAAENKNWVLLNRDAEARQKQMAEDKLKVEIMKTESEILRAKSVEDLDAIDMSQFDDNQQTSNGDMLLLDMLEERREEFSWSFEDVIHEDVDLGEKENFTPRKSRRISDFKHEEE